MDGQLHRDNIRAELGGFFNTGHAEGTITNGTFAYDEDELRSLVTQWLNLAESYQNSVADVYVMASVDGPGLEFASEGHAKAANASGDAYRRHVEASFQFSVDQAQKCQDALDDYLGVEHHNVTEVLKAGPQAGI